MRMCMLLQVAEVAFINQLLEEDKKLSLLQKLKDGAPHRRQRGCIS